MLQIILLCKTETSNMPIPFQYEIVGLEKGDNGRHCDMHIATSCGESIVVGDFVSINIETLDNGDKAVKVCKLEEGVI